ncbi:MAG: hypothetical protein CM1200mP26_15190 [Acidimicrobiales bacterium]|nr:MAG: hypothetical protein CM1200mP26_15190 [Acidimicrobiales bacterium]
MGPGGTARRHVDDDAVAGRGHDPGRPVGAQKMAGQVHVDDAAPPGLVGLEEVEHRADHAGIVDEYVDGVPRFDDGVEHGAHLDGVGHVGRGADG